MADKWIPVLTVVLVLWAETLVALPEPMSAQHIEERDLDDSELFLEDEADSAELDVSLRAVTPLFWGPTPPRTDWCNIEHEGSIRSSLWTGKGKLGTPQTILADHPKTTYIHHIRIRTHRTVPLQQFYVWIADATSVHNGIPAMDYYFLHMFKFGYNLVEQHNYLFRRIVAGDVDTSGKTIDFMIPPSCQPPTKPCCGVHLSKTQNPFDMGTPYSESYILRVDCYNQNENLETVLETDYRGYQYFGGGPYWENPEFYVVLHDGASWDPAGVCSSTSPP